MVFNKWLKFGMDAATGLFGLAATLDWQTITPTHAAAIASGIGFVRMLMSALAPAGGTTVTAPTGLVSTGK